mmetsp:Transcript_19885/g.43192  ORF Transcript_19885/g.43192 Transcript_19885/m.43192 type:complete len:217 (+) Transcript_19885:39-689(+)|eukprot:CAMPEP_0168186532 /NCGR_PEP_ID=MMETSP0139_2-20121125/14491_1 /TAXON_ID=44445 /ORGANISM="Pseudo-nitzschia australis, Strain 10249 10 AB" /LENGTH=216 /DNA_ID=CAMNT_0008108563 /DNA_START=41 /DNA_END=691 /DNA_ORIENTATION=+
MKFSAASKNNNGPVLTAVAYALLVLVAVSISKATIVIASPDSCRTLHKSDCKDSPQCKWIMFRHAIRHPDPSQRMIQCLDVKTNDECAVFDDVEEEKKLMCRLAGCRWRNKEFTCIGSAPESNNDHLAGDNDRLRPDESIVDGDFLEELIGLDGDDVMSEIKAEYPDYASDDNKYVVAICRENYFGVVACITRDYNVNRIRLIVDSDNIVIEIALG